jgi:hypothetical protein
VFDFFIDAVAFGLLVQRASTGLDLGMVSTLGYFVFTRVMCLFTWNSQPWDITADKAFDTIAREIFI